MSGITVRGETALRRFSQVIHDLYGKCHLILPVAEGEAIDALANMAERYDIPFEIVVALPIRIAWRDGDWKSALPNPTQILEYAIHRHRDLLLARDQDTHGRVSIVEQLIPLRAIHRQLENDLKVMETVALHCGTTVSREYLSEHGLHFVSEWWRAGEDVVLRGRLSVAAPLGDPAVRKEVVSTVERFYARHK